MFFSISPTGPHATSGPEAVQPSGEETNTRALGSLSVTLTFFAGDGPLSVTVRTYVNVSPGATGAVPWAFFVIATSALAGAGGYGPGSGRGPGR